MDNTIKTQDTISIAAPLEAVYLPGVLSQAIYVNDRCYIIRSAELSDTDPSMIILKGVVKERKKHPRRVEHIDAEGGQN